MKAPYKQTQHCWQTTPNIVENYMLCPLAHPVACTLLRVVGTYTVQKPVKLLQPQANGRNIVGRQLPILLGVVTSLYT